ncbi:MAG: 30S ribosomal protein S9 [Thermomicrobiales bacterium]
MTETAEKPEKVEKEKAERPAKSAKTRYHYGTGRRKCAVARVRLYPGSGVITVNGKTSPEYFGGRVIHQARIQRPLRLTGTLERYDVIVKVVGGGMSGQAGAVQHGISRALVRSDEELRPTLKKERLLTRDPRVKERKKVGLKRARKAPQYTKR